MHSGETVELYKDEEFSEASMIEPLRKLLQLNHLTSEQIDVLRNLSLLPVSGVLKNAFKKLMNLSNLNDVNHLIRYGFVIYDEENKKISLHPLIQDVAVLETTPSVLCCKTMIDSLHLICLAHGLDVGRPENVKNNNSNIIIRGDFWDFDRIYFAISKFTGDYGIDSTCRFPGYEAICESLLGLCYEIRKAQEGKRGLYEQYNGIPEHWFEKESLITNDLQDFDDDIDELNTINKDSLPEADYWDAYFSRKDFPNATTTNTLLQTELSFSEALYYAFILRELLEKKELFLLQRKALINDDSTNRCGKRQSKPSSTSSSD